MPRPKFLRVNSLSGIREVGFVYRHGSTYRRNAEWHRIRSAPHTRSSPMHGKCARNVASAPAFTSPVTQRKRVCSAPSERQPKPQKLSRGVGADFAFTQKTVVEAKWLLKASRNESFLRIDEIRSSGICGDFTQRVGHLQSFAARWAKGLFALMTRQPQHECWR